MGDDPGRLSFGAPARRNGHGNYGGGIHGRANPLGRTSPPDCRANDRELQHWPDGGPAAGRIPLGTVRRLSRGVPDCGRGIGCCRSTRYPDIVGRGVPCCPTEVSLHCTDTANQVFPMTTSHPALLRAEAFARSHHLRVPILLAPMAGACPSSLSIAVANAGGLGSCGALLMQPAAIKTWAAEVRANSNGAFALNLWIPDPKPHRDHEAENAVCTFLKNWGPKVSPQCGDVTPPDFEAQCEAMLEA